MCGFTGGPERWLRIPLDCSKPPITFAMQAMAVVRKTPAVTFFGPTTGFVVNYTPDCAVRFDLDGNPVEVFPRAYSPGEVFVQFGSRMISSEGLRRILGFIPKGSDPTLTG
jgi:hypothetical protein